MLFKSRSLLLAAGLLAIPLGAAMAQQNNPTGNLGSNRSITASPGTADNSSASTVTTGDAGSSTTTNSYGGSSTNNTVPGATGHTVVPGNNSSQASAAPSTMQEKTGGTTSDGSK
jgi:hypothetical protein